jgi:hypothetical protein
MDAETFKRFILQSNQDRFPPKKSINKENPIPKEKSEESSEDEKSEENFSDESSEEEENCCEFKAFQGKTRLNITPLQIFDKIKEGDVLQMVKCFDIDHEKFHIILDSTSNRRNPIIFTFKPRGEMECIISCAFVKNRRNSKGYLLQVEKEGNLLKVVKKIQIQNEKKQEAQTRVPKISVKMPRKREPSPDIEIVEQDHQKRAKSSPQVIEDTMNNMVKDRVLSQVNSIPDEVYEKLLKEPEIMEKFKKKVDRKADERIEKFARRKLEKYLAL